MRRFAREQSLSLVLFALFLAALAGQAPAGWHDSGRPHAATSAEG